MVSCPYNMRRIASICFLLIFLGALLCSIGWQRGKACPAYVGEAVFHLQPEESEANLVKFIRYVVESVSPTFFQQKRWPEADSEAETAKAYRDSLRYQIQRRGAKRVLKVWCLASNGAVAVDGAAFVGTWSGVGHKHLSSIEKGPQMALGRGVTHLERMAYGLGLFPPGKSVPAE